MDPGARSVPPARSVSLRLFPWPEKLRMAGSLRNSVMKLRWLGSRRPRTRGRLGSIGAGTLIPGRHRQAERTPGLRFSYVSP